MAGNVLANKTKFSKFRGQLRTSKLSSSPSYPEDLQSPAACFQKVMYILEYKPKLTISVCLIAISLDGNLEFHYYTIF